SQIFKDRTTESQIIKDRTAESQIVEDRTTESQIFKDRTTESQIIKDRTTECQIIEDRAAESQMDVEMTVDEIAKSPWGPKLLAQFESIEAFEILLFAWGLSLGFEVKRLQSRFDCDPQVPKEDCTALAHYHHQHNSQ
ncbi:hypothetical protein BGZ74_004551, partial [Mortierella antarctica]